MLLRVYRVTDKAGMLIVKSSTAAGDWLLDGVHTTVGTAKKGGGGLFSALMIVVVLVLLALKTILTGIIKIIALVLTGLLAIGRLIMGVIVRTPSKTAGGLRAGAASGGAGARPRKTQAGGMVQNTVDDEIDVTIAEDPLKVQNRRLSMAVLVMGVVVIFAVIWATDPSRTNPGGRPPTVADNPGSSLVINATPIPTQANAAIQIATPFPTATPQPIALRAGGTIAYTVRERGQTDIWAVSVGSGEPVRILNDITDERDPAFTVDGKRMAYASPQDGNWEVYTYELATGTSSRLTYELAYQGNPVWSSDGLYIAYESYQGNNLDIYAQPLDGSVEAPYRITDSPAPDFSPTWSPDGRQVAFVSWRDGNQDIYIFNLDNPGNPAANFTATPGRNEDFPSWSPDGRYLAYSAVDAGREKVFIQPLDGSSGPQVIGLGRTPAWSPDSSALTYAVDADDKSVTYLYAVPIGRAGGVSAEVATVPYGSTNPVWSREALPAALVSSGGLDVSVTEPLFVEQEQQYPNDAPYRLNALLDVETQRPFLSDRVNDSFNALRIRVAAVTGLDFLATLDDAWWDLERQPEPGEERRNWHMTGRAFAIPKNSILGFPAGIEVVREDTETATTWRVYVRVAESAQAGNLGEPLRRMPWDLLSRNQGDVQAYNEGGRLKTQFPTGYYVDFTQLAADYGWERYPAGSDWRANANSINYWLFYKPDGLSWCQAMLEIQTPGALVNFNCTPDS